MTQPADSPSQAHMMITGATGFIGQSLCRVASRKHFRITACYRNQSAIPAENPDNIDWIRFDSDSHWDALSERMASVDTLVHLAARVHQMQEHASDPEQVYYQYNVAPVARLAQIAAAAGTARFVFISSIKALNHADPNDHYGRSKYLAEQALKRIAADTGLELVIIRPPLVYGPGVGANFKRLIQLTRSGLPLPLASIENCRSMVYVDNLADLIAECARSPKAAGQEFEVSDLDVSTPELLQKIAQAMGRKVRLWPFPVSLLHLLAGLAGQQAIMERLAGSLRVDSQPVLKQLGWKPPVATDVALRETIAAYV